MREVRKRGTKEEEVLRSKRREKIGLLEIVPLFFGEKTKFKEKKDVRMVIIDPLSAYGF